MIITLPSSLCPLAGRQNDLRINDRIDKLFYPVVPKAYSKQQLGNSRQRQPCQTNQQSRLDFLLIGRYAPIQFHPIFDTSIFFRG